MADYPSVGYTYRSKRKPLTTRKVVQKGDGSAIIQEEYTTSTYLFTVQHGPIDDTDLASITDHFAAHRTAEFAFTWMDGNTYTVAYADEPDTEQINGAWNRATVELIGRLAA